MNTPPSDRRDHEIPGAESTEESGAGATSRRRFLRLLAAGSAGATAALSATPAVLVGRTREPDSPAAPPASTSRRSYSVFSPGRIGNLTLKNRCIREAAFEGTGNGDGYSTQSTRRILREYAEGGVAMVFTGYQAVMEYGRRPSALGIWDDKFIPGHERIRNTVRAADPGVFLGAQLGHDGTSRPGWVLGKAYPRFAINPWGEEWPERISPSGVRGEGDHALTVPEIERFCADMGRAAYRVRQAGWDAVMIHGAHGYLISTFFSPATNRRTDEYGGDIHGRVHIVRRIVSEIRDRCGPDFPIVCKVDCFSGERGDGHTWPVLADALAATGIDALDISGGSRRNLPTWAEQSYYRQFAQAIDVDVPVILGHGHRDIELLEIILKEDQGKIDFLSFARPLIREPGLINRWRDGVGPSRALCTDSSACFAEVTSTGAPIYCVVAQQELEALAG